MAILRPFSHCHKPYVALLLLSLGAGLARPAQAICKGSPVNAGFDFVAALYIGNNLECGGTLLEGGWILTAAHCGNIQTAVVGSKNLKTIHSVNKIPVVGCFRHSGFDRTTGEDDLALIKLSNGPPPLPTGISLVVSTWVEGNDPLTIVGYSPECTGTMQLEQA